MESQACKVETFETVQNRYVEQSLVDLFVIRCKNIWFFILVTFCCFWVCKNWVQWRLQRAFVSNRTSPNILTSSENPRITAMPPWRTFHCCSQAKPEIWRAAWMHVGDILSGNFLDKIWGCVNVLCLRLFSIFSDDVMFTPAFWRIASIQAKARYFFSLFTHTENKKHENKQFVLYSCSCTWC